MPFPKLGTVALVASAMAHSGAYLLILNAPGGSSSFMPPTTASFAILPVPPNVPDIAPPAPKPVEKSPIPKDSPPRANELPPAAPPPPDSDESSEAVAAAPAADLTGITLTNAIGTGWLSATGDGSSRAGPLRNVQAPRPASTSTDPSSSRPGRSERARRPAPATVAPEDLSQPPRAPDLNTALEANYPPEARAAGLSGFAVIRARISSTGEARSLGMLTESSPGFGAACLRTLTGSRWSAPVDRAGRTVATEIRYRCTFRVAR